MNNHSSIAGTPQYSSGYTLLHGINGEAGHSVPSRKVSPSWRKFIRPVTIQPESTSVPDERITAKRPTVLKPAPFPEDYDEQVKAFFSFIDYLETRPDPIDDVITEQ